MNTIIAAFSSYITEYDNARTIVDNGLFSRCDIPNFVIPTYSKRVTSYPFTVAFPG